MFNKTLKPSKLVSLYNFYLWESCGVGEKLHPYYVCVQVRTETQGLLISLILYLYPIYFQPFLIIYTQNPSIKTNTTQSLVMQKIHSVLPKYKCRFLVVLCPGPLVLLGFIRSAQHCLSRCASSRRCESCSGQANINGPQSFPDRGMKAYCTVTHISIR